MTTHRVGLRAAGAWLVAGSGLLVMALAFHGPLHPDLEVQMTRIAESAVRWRVVHWIAAASLSCFAVGAVLVLASGSRLTSTGKVISAWGGVLLGALWTLTTALAEVTVMSEAKAPQPLVPKWSAAVGAGAGLASFAGWCLGVWFDVGPANLLWVVASGVMCLWLAWLGTMLGKMA